MHNAQQALERNPKLNAQRGLKRTDLGPTLAEPDPWAERQALVHLAHWCQRFSPTVGLDSAEPPESLLLDMTGLGVLFRGEEGLLAHVMAEFRRRNLMVRAALADTIGAAWAMAHYAGRERYAGMIVPPGQAMAAIEPLAVEALRLSPPTVQLLRELGLVRIGQLPLVPREEIAARFGSEPLLRLDQAAGRVAEVIVHEMPPPVVEAAWTFESPAERQELIQSALRAQLERLASQLAGGRLGVRQLECRLSCLGAAGTSIVSVRVGLYRASAAPAHLEELVALQLDSVTLPGPVSAVAVAVLDAAPLEYRQRELFEGPRRLDPRSVAILIDRLSGRLGRESVVRARLIADAQPEYTWRYEPLVGGAEATSPSAGRQIRKDAYPKTKRRKAKKQPPNLPADQIGPLPCLARPLHLLPEPLQLAMLSVAPDGPPLGFRWAGKEHRTARIWGPERIETGWWRGQGIRRDYYRVETTSGQWLWIFRRLNDGAWFLQGQFS